MNLREVLILVSGHNKTRALGHAIEEGGQPFLDGQRLQLRPKGIIVADEDSTMELKVGTARYFKEIETKNFYNEL